MKKQRRGKFTYIPKDEIAEVTTFNDVTFENDDLLDGAYVKGRKKYARGGVMKEMSLEQQAAFAVGNDVWFSLPDIEKAELVEELVKSGMITPTASETDVRIMELIEQDNYADGGNLSEAIYLEGTGWVMPKTINKLNEDGVSEPTMVYEPIESMNKKNYADGGYTNKFASMKGGISYFSVDIDTEDGENVRDLEFKSYEKAKKVYDKYKKSMEYDGQAIEDIQLIVNYKNGDYDSIGDSEMMADGGKTLYHNKDLDYKYLSYARKNLSSLSDEELARIYAKMKGLDFSDILIEILGNPVERQDVINEILQDEYNKLNNINGASFADGGMMADGGTTKLARGGFDVGRWYRDSSGEEFKYVGEDVKGNTLFSDGVKTIKKPIEDFGSSVKEEKLFSWFAKGGVATEGKFLVKYYLKESPNDFKEKIFDDRDKAEFFFETIQDDDDIVVMPIEEVVEKASAPTKSKNLFSAAKPVPVTKTAAKKRERVEVNGISELIRRYDELNAKIKDAEAAKSTIGGELKEIGREKFLDLYEERGFRPANFDLADGNENILLEVTDKYLKVEPEKAAMLEQFDGLLEVKTTYEFNAEILEKKVSDSMTVGDVVSMLIQDSKLLSDSDKENLIKAKTTMRVPKGTIDRLLEYDNPREVFNLISPILALK